MVRRRETKGPPMITVRDRDLTLSAKNRPRVCLLNPCFFSIRNVEYWSIGKGQVGGLGDGDGDENKGEEREEKINRPGGTNLPFRESRYKRLKL